MSDTLEQRAREHYRGARRAVWSPGKLVEFISDFARVEVVRALERAAEENCRWCAGEGCYSRKPKPNKDHGMLMHLAQGYPPRACGAAGVRTLSTEYQEADK